MPSDYVLAGVVCETGCEGLAVIALIVVIAVPLVAVMWLLAIRALLRSRDVSGGASWLGAALLVPCVGQLLLWAYRSGLHRSVLLVVVFGGPVVVVVAARMTRGLHADTVDTRSVDTTSAAGE